MAGRGGAGAGSWDGALDMDVNRNQGRVDAGWFDIMRSGLKDQRLQSKCTRNDDIKRVAG